MTTRQDSTVEPASERFGSTPAPTPDPRASGQTDGIVRVLLVDVTADSVIVELTGTTYRLRLICDEPESLRSRIGRRINGRIEGRALRMHAASAGGRFIEPADGMPRNVQGSVRAVDPATGRVLVDMAVPVWVAPLPQQCFEDVAIGDLVNFYMQSGTRFIPID